MDGAVFAEDLVLAMMSFPEVGDGPFAVHENEGWSELGGDLLVGGLTEDQGFGHGGLDGDALVDGPTSRQ